MDMKKEENSDFRLIAYWKISLAYGEIEIKIYS